MIRLWRVLKQYRDGHQPLYHISLVLLFWAIADGIASFSLPIFMKQVLGDLFLVGVIFGSSSFFGLLIDFFLGSEQKGRTFKPYFLGSIFLALITYLLVIKANSWQIFLLIMALWGFYFEIINFGLIDFLNRFTKKWEHAQSSGVVQMFSSLGYLLAPLIAGYMIFKNRTAILGALFFMLLAGFSFIWWFGDKKTEPEPPAKKLAFLEEFRLWWRVGRKTLWVWTASLLLSLWDSLIWSMGPILLVSTMAEKAAYVMACFGVPSVFLQGYVGHWADKKGKKEFLIIGLLIMGIFLGLFSLTDNIILKIFMALISATGASFIRPTASGLFIDMIDGYRDEEEEIAGIKGLAHNLGFIIGPVTAGFLGKSLGLPTTFLIFGVLLTIGALLMKLFWRK